MDKISISAIQVEGRVYLSSDDILLMCYRANTVKPNTFPVWFIAGIEKARNGELLTRKTK